MSATYGPARANGITKAAEDSRTPRRCRDGAPATPSARFWSAAVLCRFELRSMAEPKLRISSMKPMNWLRITLSPSDAGEGRGEGPIWNLVFGAFLGFGVWDLELPPTGLPQTHVGSHR